MRLSQLKALIPPTMKAVVRSQLHTGLTRTENQLASLRSRWMPPAPVEPPPPVPVEPAPQAPVAPPLTRELIAAHYLRGEGLEIGALCNPTKLPAGARARYVDVAPIDVLRSRFPEVADRIVTPDIIDNGEELGTVAAESQDFVIANHVLEHCENPIGTVKNFIRVLRPGGILFMAIPDKRFTFDLPRAITPTAHVVEDYLKGPEGSRRAHYDEWLRLIDRKEGEELAHLTEAFIRDRVNIHFHVWTLTEMFEMFTVARDQLGLPFNIRMVFLDPSCLEAVWILEVKKPLP
ncbi:MULTISPECIES: class I SAM-dependent methyltransferase [unclassified Corallococcus]|uniref:class I SAM-dependent methyltransferase n=1 Tax=unclassified Corallococcus TaxID=2685029 RepID=UPI001A8F6E80|nr:MULTISPECIES: methyltransferase domain-containing protein [unclassified Corallococcus]MBN9684527.1 methyltransferase domain-containing protein [Corallococcus sp. NCSPR001]WAS83999.1 methyltransferase domain-containing protein [Corallococcus sp. NCRR]